MLNNTNWDWAGQLTNQRRARQQRFADAVQRLDTHDDEAHELPRHPLEGPQPTLGSPPVLTPRPPVGKLRAYFPAQEPSVPTPAPGQVYGSVGTFQQGAIGHTAPVVVNGRATTPGSV